jgi:ABC-type antimicrobial peptide transport system permease subunit
MDSAEKPMDFIYLPLTQHPLPQLTLMIHCSGDALQLIQPLKETVRTLDPNLPLLRAMSYEEFYLNKAVRGPGIAVKLVAGMGLVGLFLAVAGLYGVMVYNVSRRTREIGIRMAIGARSSDVLRLVLGKGLVLVGLGTLIGLAMGLAVERLMDSMLFNAGRIDAVVYLAVVPALVAVTMLAAYFPARKASRIAPTQALRYE